MTTFHLVSHTHWDREWFEPFQISRLKLVQLVDRLFSILERDLDYRCFTLDGQTIVLEDYLSMRPGKREQLARYISSGRILIGPWHVLPDEFLVSPESTIRNLLHGEQEAKHFNAIMKVGYIPDPFGHIGQMPQILQGFDIQSAAVQRGLDDQPCEIWWQSPDGSRILTAYLRDGYYNASQLPMDSAESFTRQFELLANSLLPYVASGQALLMHGDDFKEPSAETSCIVADANRLLDGKTIIHSNLPAYINAVHAEIQAHNLVLPTVTGDLRSPKRAPLLVGVLSSRMWIKQRNSACETLLEKWASPFSAIAATLDQSEPHLSTQNGKEYLLKDPQSILHQAYDLLMQCHPHDSICGCSIDQVHDEMKVRFDQVDQICESLTFTSLSYLARSVNTRAPGKPIGALVVFNPSSSPRNDEIYFSINGLAGVPGYDVIDDRGQKIPYLETSREQKELFMVTVPMGFLIEALGGPSVNTPPEIILGLKQLLSGSIQEYHLSGYAIETGENGFQLTVHMSIGGEVIASILEKMQQEVQDLVKNPAMEEFTIRGVSEPTIYARAVVPDVPGIGYRTLWVYPQTQYHIPAIEDIHGRTIENEYFQVEIDPNHNSLILVDKLTQVEYHGLHRFVDGGDAGDEYNYSPPAQDHLIRSQIDSYEVKGGPGFQILILYQTIQVPMSLTEDRQGRSERTRSMVIKSEITLKKGVRRVDIHTEIDNNCLDHRLRVHFSAPFTAASADYDGHFEVVNRPITLPEFDAGWVEQPRPEKPQRFFTDLSDGRIGLMIANRGLPEGEAILHEDGSAEFALTLLRCIGWLSRGDLTTRSGHAGPGLPTPGAQMQGKWSFDYSIIPHAGSWNNGFQEAYAFTTPLRTMHTNTHEGTLGTAGSFIRMTPGEFALSTVKPAEDGDGIILRGYNLTDTPIPVRLNLWRNPSRCVLVRLDEQPIQDLALPPDGSIQFEAGKHKVVTLKITI